MKPEDLTCGPGKHIGENSAHSFTEGSDSGTLKFSNPVSTVKPIQFDVEGIQCNERGGLCFNLTCALNGKCCDFVSRNEYFRLKNEEYQKAYSDLLKENQELKALIQEIENKWIRPDSYYWGSDANQKSENLLKKAQ